MKEETAAYYFAKALFELELNPEVVKDTLILLQNKELIQILDHPVMDEEQKHSVIEKLFPNEVWGFVKVLCSERRTELSDRISSEYDRLVLCAKNMMRAQIRYVSLPTPEEIENMKKMLAQKFGKTEVFLELIQDESLIGGYEMVIENTVYDSSIKGTLNRLKNALSGR